MSVTRVLACLTLSGVITTDAASLLRQSSVLDANQLPAEQQATLKKVKAGVESLKLPSKAEKPVSTPAQQSGPAGAMSDCSLLGGLVSAKLTSQCCTSAQVVTQRQLKEYGMAQACKPGWKCEGDDTTPMASFEVQSLSSMCGEPGCLPKVVSAFRSHSLTSEGADSMSNICASLATMNGGNASAEAISHMLSDTAGRAGKGANKEEKEKCQKDNCDTADKKKVYCAANEAKKDKPKCYQYCCKEKKESQCFPGEALVQVEQRGEVPLAKVKNGDKVLVKSAEGLTFEPVLTFLHTIRKEDMEYVIVKHVNGVFRASASHLVFVVTSDGLGAESKMVGALKAGDEIFATGPQGHFGDLARSRVVDIQHGTTSSMHAPLTSSGTIVVDGVLASNYASPSEGKHLTHSVAHMFLLPLRVYHSFGLADRLAPFWKWYCGSSGSKKLLCTGDSSEEVHPFARVAWKTLRVDSLLWSQ